MCDLSGDERAEVWRVSWHRARKQHVCECCRSIIRVSARYQRTFMVFEGEPDSNAMCEACALALEEFGKAHRFYPWASSFIEYLEECVVDDDEGSRWTPMLTAIQKRRAEARA